MSPSTDRRQVFALVVALAVVAPATGSGAAAAASTTASANAAPAFVAVYPNPTTDGDAGEYAVVRFPSATNVSEWMLSDGESTVRLPDATVSGRVALSTDPALARNRTDARVLGLAGDLSLANAGETVRLLRGDVTVDSVAYDDAPEAERWHRVDTDRSGSDRTGARSGRAPWEWTPLGATDFRAVRTRPDSVEAFVLPDDAGVPVDVLRRADRRILLAGYSFASERAADALAAAADRGVSVRVLVDDAPVGGVHRREARLLDSLVARGVAVRVVGSRLARYDFHHAKYAVADDRALVLTENWKPAGTGGRSSRGWGAVVRGAATADRLAAVFRADAGWRGAVPWSSFRRGRHFAPAERAPANGSYPAAIDPRNVSIASSKILVAPDNAEQSLVGLLDGANESIRVQQLEIGSRRLPAVRALVRAARRGVRVRVLLSSAWYVAEDNRAIAAWLNRVADREDLPLDARLADPRGRYEKIHAKGVVVDGDAAVVGSLNWNRHSARQNREVAVLLRGEAVGRYYADAFDADWRASADGGGGGEHGIGGRVPVGLLAGVAIGALAAILVGNREIRFEK